jgi:hypothetical protein
MSTPKSSNRSPVIGSGMKPIMFTVQMKSRSEAT